jgi:hypothetical protein
MRPTYIFDCPGHAERSSRQSAHKSHYLQAQKAHYIKHLPFFKYLYKFKPFMCIIHLMPHWTAVRVFNLFLLSYITALHPQSPRHFV